MANTELSNKLNSALRYGGATAGTAFAFLALISILSPEQVAELKAQVEILNNSIITGYGALIKMWIILGPIAIGVAAKLGWNSSSVQAMAGKLLTIATNVNDPKGATEAKVVLVNAAASKDIGSQGVVNPEMAANPATAANVVAAAPMLPPKP